MGGLQDAEAKVAKPERGTTSAPAGDRPAATLVGQRIEWSQISPLMGEAAGATVVEEVAIDLLARRELESRGLTITRSDVDAEEGLLLTALTRAGAGGPRAGELIMQMRAARGLGPARYRSLLERNAMLRRLVKDECEPSPEQLSQGMEVRFGPRYVARIIVTSSQQEASVVHSKVNSLPEDQREVAFATEAFTRSADPSKDRGGLLEPISPADASYASAVRAALPGLKPHQLSPIIALDSGYAVLMGVSKIEGQTPPPDGEELVRGELRARLERVAMDQLARRLLLNSPPTVFDSSINWSWQNRK